MTDIVSIGNISLLRTSYLLLSISTNGLKELPVFKLFSQTLHWSTRSQWFFFSSDVFPIKDLPITPLGGRASVGSVSKTKIQGYI